MAGASPIPEKQLVAAADGAGPLLQRDYWAVIRDCRLRPSQVAALVANRFAEFAPAELCRFARPGRATRPLEVGDELDVEIRWAGATRVVVVNREPCSITLATVDGHPEAGRITFGAYRNDRGDVVFHIRSRARSSSELMYAGFLVSGDPMQTNTWTEFVNRVALTAGAGVVGAIRADMARAEDEPEDRGVPSAPTYVARGD